jgi:hypothetical protein
MVVAVATAMEAGTEGNRMEWNGREGKGTAGGERLQGRTFQR